jgi:glycosyltransferase involved in cell wall biosynthesis
MVSIIVPVYNTEKYIDRCIESLVNQTLKDIEIIIINDGSTDNSHEKCELWAKKDNRIIYYHKENEGKGPTRDFGIRKAKYNYITFTDSDDYRDTTSIEKLYNAIIKNGADVAVHDFYRVKIDSVTGKHELSRVKHWLFDDDVVVNRDIIFRGDVEFWAKLFKKELFAKNGIIVPNHAAEALSIMPLILACATKVVHVKEPLYYYWVNNQDSATNRFEIVESVLAGLGFLKKSFLSRKFFLLFETQLQRIAFIYIKNALNQANLMKKQVRFERYHKLHSDLLSFAAAEFSAKRLWGKTGFVIGSYSLRTVVNNANLELSQLKGHYQYSSLISIMSNRNQNLTAVSHHGNNYRNEMFKADIEKTAIQNICGEEKSDFLYIDFLEERYNIIDTGAGYLTASENFYESDLVQTIPCIILQRDSEKVTQIWQESCLQFISYVKEHYIPEQIILVKFKLSEYFGEYGPEELFPNIGEIRRINDILMYYYSFFEEHFKGIEVFNIEADKYYFSDKTFRYGCYPYHINDYVYTEIAWQLGNKPAA